MKPQTFLILLLLLLAACQSPSEPPKEPAQATPAPSSAPQKLTRLDSSMVHLIRQHYLNHQDPDWRLEEASDDTTLQLSFYHVPTKDDSFDGCLLSVSIPLLHELELFAAMPVLQGDLNQDGQNDYVITVHTEGGGGGGNVWDQDLFVFLGKGNSYSLACITPDGDICGCDGDFRARRIEGQYLIGNSSCYAPEDGHCCPSLHYETKVAFEKKGLRFVSQVPRKVEEAVLE